MCVYWKIIIWFILRLLFSTLKRLTTVAIEVTLAYDSIASLVTVMTRLHRLSVVLTVL